MTPRAWLRPFALAAAGGVLAVALGPARLAGDYTQFVAASLAIAFIAVFSVNLLAGLCGIWSLGHSAFVAIGAYLAANLTPHGVPVEAIVLAAMLLAGAVGFALGLSAGRFSVLYFGLLTLALALVATEVIGRWTAVTNGDDGMKVGRALSVFVRGPIASKDSVVLCILMATFVLVIGDTVQRSRYGRRWLAVKGQRTASMAIGLRPPLENAAACGLSAALASTSGVAMAFTIAFIDPVAFNLDSGISMIVGTVVGGIGSGLGALLGAGFITAVPEFARDARDVADFVYGAAMIVVLLLLGEGVVPAIRSRWRARRGRRRPHEHAGGSRRTPDPAAIAALVTRLLPRADRELRLDGITLRFSGLVALDGVSLALPAGRALGLIGPNGAGKTSLLNVLSGFYRPEPTSSVRLGETDVLALSPSHRAALGIGRTFQHAELFPELTVREALTIAAAQGRALRRRHGLEPSDPDAVADALLDGLALRAHADALPAELPFGVQKVADIGRALALGCPVILMDEPFSGLDADESAELRAILHGMRRAGVSFLIIDHAVQEVLDVCDRIVVLDFGRVLMAGTPDEVRGDERVRTAYFGSLQNELTCA